MRIEFLGTGGAIRTPRPGCDCKICQEARVKGVPYSRSGPGVFIHDIQLLIDTSEDIAMQLNRANISSVKACLYSHWHPDHTMGRRIFETLNADFSQWPPVNGMTDVYFPEQVAADAEAYLGIRDHFAFMEDKQKSVRTHTILDGEHIVIGGVTITPLRLAEDYVYAFVIDDHHHRILIAPDELNGWMPDESLQHMDLVILPTGVFGTHPLTGEQHLAENHPVLDEEATFQETLHIVERLAPKHCYLTHVEEPDRVSYDDLCQVEKQLQARELPVSFAYDGLKVHI